MNTIEIKLHAGYADGHVESFTASETAMMKVIRNRFTNETYEDYDKGPGYFYLPIEGLR